jgi:hypothetical protein
MTTEKLIEELFDKLDNWRNLPAYQLERRADIFFAIYLKDIIHYKYRIEIDIIIPEFPIRRGDLKEFDQSDNLSFKIDYLAVSESSDTVFLIELKTDDLSIREEQKKVMNEIGNSDVKMLTESVLKIKKASKSKKYEALIKMLSEIGWIDNGKTHSKKEYKFHVVYIKPGFVEKTDKDLDIITFKQVINSIEHRKDKLTRRFIESLERWQKNPVGGKM